MDEFLGKQYIMVSEEHFENYLVFLGFRLTHLMVSDDTVKKTHILLAGVSYIYRKVAINLKPIHCLTCNDDGTYTFTFRSNVANSTCSFKPGEKFMETKADGVKVQALITFEENIMTHTQIEEDGRTSIHVRKFYPDKLVVTTTAMGFDKTVTRIFELVQ